GAVTSSGGAVTSAGGAVTGPASAGGRGAGGRGRRSFGATRAAPPTSSTASTPSTINRTISGSMPTILSDPVPSAYHGPPNGCVVKYGSDAGAGDRDAARHAVPGPGEPGRDRDLSRRQHRVPTRWFDDHALRTNREHTVPTVGHVAAEEGDLHAPDRVDVTGVGHDHLADEAHARAPVDRDGVVDVAAHHRGGLCMGWRRRGGPGEHQGGHCRQRW